MAPQLLDSSILNGVDGEMWLVFGSQYMLIGGKTKLDTQSKQISISAVAQQGSGSVASAQRGKQRVRDQHKALDVVPDSVASCASDYHLWRSANTARPLKSG